MSFAAFRHKNTGEQPADRDLSIKDATLAGSCEYDTVSFIAFQPRNGNSLRSDGSSGGRLSQVAYACVQSRHKASFLSPEASMSSATLVGFLLTLFPATFMAPEIHIPQEFNTNFLMLVRWIHFLAGITWIGLLYFFNLVNVQLMKELDAKTKSKVTPPLMLRALWWFRISAAVTVLMGLIYWGYTVAGDAHNAQLQGFAGASSGIAMASFFVIWTIVWGILYGSIVPGKGIFDNGAFIGVVYAVVVGAAAWLFLSLNNHGWESNRLLAIGIGGGIGWVMLLNVWGVIWRIQKRLIQWTRDNADNGTPMPDKAKAMARQAFLVSRANAFLSIPLLFFMGAASHYPMFGK